VSNPIPPTAPRRPHWLEAHGRRRIDDWYWLADRSDPEVLAYLRAENDYADAVLAPTLPLQEELYEEIKGRVVETDAGPPTRDGTWWYWSRTSEGQQYRVLCRRPDVSRSLRAEDVVADARRGRAAEEIGEQVLLDENALAAGSPYLAVGVFDVSPDQRTLAYAFDLDGSESYTLRFRDIDSGVDYDDVITGVYYGSAWALDNETFFYMRPDHAMRPWQVWRHRLGTTPETADGLVYQEDDERFFLELGLSRSNRYVMIHAASKTSSEARWIDAQASASNEPQVILIRQPDVEYDVEDDAAGWLVRTNRPGPDGIATPNFALYRLPAGSSNSADLEVVLPHRSDVMLESFDAFADHTVVSERSQADGLQRIRLLFPDGTEKLVTQQEAVYSLAGESNPEWQTNSYRFGYTSLVTPRSSMELDVATLAARTVWTQLVLGGYDPSRYRTERLWATAADGTQVPLSIVAPRQQPLDGSAACLLYGYGAYELSIDPSFSPARLNLLERGMSFAIAHIRGGGELGRGWYEAGRMAHKSNTFGDFVAAATYLVETGWTRPDRLVARGASAGGLLMGAVANLRPDLWTAIVAEVPFVDVVTTMSDTSLPLTVTEWEEWGDPVHDPEAYRRMLDYSPYDNVTDAPYPAMFVTAGLNDPRVGYWEPAKWVAKLRSVAAGRPDHPILLRTELGAGHQGSTGRYDAWRDEARIQAFILTQVGLGTARRAGGGQAAGAAGEGGGRAAGEGRPPGGRPGG
jgi:oligopeptidase B